MRCELGLFVKCPHPEMIEAMALAGFDFAVVDMEHTPLGPRDLYPLILAAENRKMPLIVRIPQKSEMHFKWCRDLNIKLIQVPNVETVEDVQYATRHTNFAPRGERGLCRFVRAANFSALTKDAYLEYANSDNQLIFQIEGKNALVNLPTILTELPPQSSIFIGPYDLSQSLGKPGQIWDPEVVAAMDSIIKMCRPKGIRVGTFTDTLEGLEFWANRGLAYLEYASDLNVFISGSQSLINSFRRSTNNL